MGQIGLETPVLWHSQQDGRGHYNCTSMINDVFDYHECTHYAGFDGPPKDMEGAVVVVHGGREPGRLSALNMHIAELRWVLLIFLGDEEASFPAEQVVHSNKICWVQEPLPGKHEFADRFILDGYTPHTRKLRVELERDLDWVFAGQVTHQRRRACVDALRTIDWGGVIVETKGYCQGVSISEYHELLCRAKIVPCPSGPFSPDSARVCESLECGAIPILDDLSPTRPEPGFWKLVLGDHPLPVITDWNYLPAYIGKLKLGWEIEQRRIKNWWQWYKESMFFNFGADVHKLKTRANV